MLYIIFPTACTYYNNYSPSMLLGMLEVLEDLDDSSTRSLDILQYFIVRLASYIHVYQTIISNYALISVLQWNLSIVVTLGPHKVAVIER